MTKEKDIVTDILVRVEVAVRAYLKNDAGFEQSMMDAISAQIRAQERPVRQHWGRSEAYIAARSAQHDEAKAEALAEVKRTGKVAQATRHGVSRATLYRLLSKKD